MAKAKRSKTPHVSPSTLEKIVAEAVKAALRDAATVIPDPEVPQKEVDKLAAKDKECPHCGKVKNVGRDFGIRYSRGIPGPHSWCRQCRANTNYRALPRKYRVKGYRTP